MLIKINIKVKILQNREGNNGHNNDKTKWQHAVCFFDCWKYSFSTNMRQMHPIFQALSLVLDPYMIPHFNANELLYASVLYKYDFDQKS